MSKLAKPRAALGRRRFLAGVTALGAMPLLAQYGSTAARPEPRLVEARLTAGPAQAQLVPPQYPQTDVWAYNGTVPGPVL
ncbi:MAG TPA: hypothetical protein VK043_12785, partial [Burkholderiales bacterium]|nr:hypothetical protein [Burkholderiales bacterium]